MTGLVVLVGVLWVFRGLQSGVLAQDGRKLSYPRALERLESLVATMNESLHQTKEDLHEVRLCLNQTKKILGKVQEEKESLEAALLETRRELSATKSLHQQLIDDLRAAQDSSRVKALERQGSKLEKGLKQVKRKVSGLEDEQLSERITAIENEQLPRQLNELTGDFTELKRDLKTLEDETLPRRVNEVFVNLDTLTSTVEEQGNEIARLKENVEQIKIGRQGKETFDNLATSCKDVYECDPTAPSGYYWIRNATGSAVQVFCQMNTTNCGDITGGWMRAAYINMTDRANSCPQGLITYTQSSTRFCSSSLSTGGCTSVTFPTYGVPFTKVCGRALGYQYGHIDAFDTIDTINSHNVEGLSVTHGTPRNHIWTFAAGKSKDFLSHGNCPCAPNPGAAATSFVGENYFCESGNTGFIEYQWYLDDPLWDSQGCAVNSTCCDRGGPWFTTTLKQEVSDDIEVSWCVDFSNEECGVEQLEIYIN